MTVPAGAVNATLNFEPSPTTGDATGEVGADERVTATTVELPTPDPPAFTARIFTLYDVAADRPVIVIGEVMPGVFRGVQAEPPLVEYS